MHLYTKEVIWMIKIPLKWKKHLMLPMFGLREIEDLQKEIHRYNSKNIAKAVEDIKNDMQIDENKSNLYTISLVKNNQLHNLPNINIANIQELKNFYNKYSKNKEFSEIWFCKKKKNKDQTFLVGRISFDTRKQLDNIDSQILEQVWNTSHRDIENYNEKYTKAYIRASRKDWGMRYSINKLSIPQNSNLNKEKIISQFTEVVKEIERKRENIEILSEYLKKLDINQFSLEYLLQEGKFLFIDWDSQNDLKAINGIIREDDQR